MNYPLRFESKAGTEYRQVFDRRSDGSMCIFVVGGVIDLSVTRAILVLATRCLPHSAGRGGAEGQRGWFVISNLTAVEFRFI